MLPSDSGSPAEYAPVLYGAARVQYTDTKRGIDVTRSLQAIVSFASGPIPVDWERAEETPHPPETLDAAVGERRGAASAASTSGARQEALRRVDQGLRAVGHARAAAQDLFGAVDEARLEAGRIRTRLSGAHPARRTRDARRGGREAARAIRAEAGASAGEGTQSGRSRRQGAAAGVAAEAADGRLDRRDDARRADGTPRGLALHARAARRRRREASADRPRKPQDVAKAQERLQEAQAELAALEAELQQEVAALEGAAPGGVAVETIEIKPKRGGVDVRIVALAWKPIPS